MQCKIGGMRSDLPSLRAYSPFKLAVTSSGGQIIDHKRHHHCFGIGPGGLTSQVGIFGNSAGNSLKEAKRPNLR